MQDVLTDEAHRGNLPHRGRLLSSARCGRFIGRILDACGRLVAGIIDDRRLGPRRSLLGWRGRHAPRSIRSAGGREEDNHSGHCRVPEAPAPVGGTQADLVESGRGRAHVTTVSDSHREQW